MPTWALVLEAAGYDPLRAKEIFEQLDELWWQRWLLERRHRLKKQAETNGESRD